MRKTSIAHLSALDASPRELVEIAEKCGYDHVGLRLLPVTAGETPSVFIEDRLLRRDFVSYAADRGVGVLDVELFKLTPETQVVAFEPALAAARELGASHALTQIHDPDCGRAAERFAQLCDLAASYQLTCDVEFLSWTDMRDIASARRLLMAAGKPNGGICLDTLHFWRSRCGLDDIERLPAGCLRFVQIADARGPRDVPPEEMIRVAREEREMPGDGEIDLAGILARLPPQTPLSIEIPNVRLARRLTHEERMCVAKAKLMRVLSTLGARAA